MHAVLIARTRGSPPTQLVTDGVYLTQAHLTVLQKTSERVYVWMLPSSYMMR